MRKLVVSMNLSLDGFLSSPSGGLEWHTRYWCDDIGEAMGRQLAEADTILLGRRTYDAMAAYWQGIACCGARGDLPFADMIYHHTKILVSRHRKEGGWHNSLVWNGTIGSKLRQWKQRGARDIVLYGSASLMSSLLSDDLIDEYRLWIHPVVLGKGRSMFKAQKHMLKFALVEAQSFSSGVVLLTYKR